MAYPRRPTPVAPTIVTGLMACSLAVILLLLNVPRWWVVGCASFGLAILIRGVYVVLRVFDDRQDALWKGTNHGAVPALPPLVAPAAGTTIASETPGRRPVFEPERSQRHPEA